MKVRRQSRDLQGAPSSCAARRRAAARWSSKFPVAAVIVSALAMPLMMMLPGCGAVDFLRRDIAAPRDRASRFDRFANELALDLRDTAPLLERIRLGDQASALDRASWSDERRREARRRIGWSALKRLASEFSPDRFDGQRAALARVMEADLRALLGLDSKASIDRSADLPPAPEDVDLLPGPIERLAATPWSGLMIEAPSVLAAEHPARTAEDLAAWEQAIEDLAEESSFLGASPAALATLEHYAAGPQVMNTLIDDVALLQSSAGAGGRQDPLFGPLLEAAERLPGPAAERALRTSSKRRDLQKTLRIEFDRLVEALGEVRKRASAQPFSGTDAPSPAASDAWLRRMQEAAGANVDPDALADLARTEVQRLTLALGDPFGFDPVDPRLARKVLDRLAEIRSRSVEPPGANEVKRKPETLWDPLRERLGELVADCPPVLVSARIARTFERPHGRWSPFVRGDVAPPTEPLARPSLFLEARERDPISPAWLREAEALRYGLPGRAVADAFRRKNARTSSRYWQLFEREAFEEGWGLYAVAAASELGLLLEQDGGFGRLSQELIVFATLGADVGIHASGWTTSQATEYLTENTPLPPSAVRDIVTRILADPGRAALPAIGLLRLRSLRRGAEAIAGESFDPAQFHAALLSGGPIPMGEMDARIELWLSGRPQKDDR